MAAPGAPNQIDRRILDDLIYFSGQTSVDGNLKFFKEQQIAAARHFVIRQREDAQTATNLISHFTALLVELEAPEDPGEVWDSIMKLRDDKRPETIKLNGINQLIADAEEEIKLKEEQMARMAD